MRITAPIAFALVTGASVGCNRPTEPTPEPVTDLGRLQGKWRMVQLGTDKKEIPPVTVAELDLVLTIKDTDAEFTEKGKLNRRFRISVDSGTDPKGIDLLPIDEHGNAIKIMRPRRAEQGGGIVTTDEGHGPQMGLFEVKGDRLRITTGGNEKVGRPKSFDDWKTDSSVLGWTLDRVKE